MKTPDPPTGELSPGDDNPGVTLTTASSMAIADGHRILGRTYDVFDLLRRSGDRHPGGARSMGNLNGRGTRSRQYRDDALRSRYRAPHPHPDLGE